MKKEGKGEKATKVMRLWTMVTRGYAVISVLVMAAIWLWHALRPDSPGIPYWLFVWGPVPMWGILVLPLCLIVEAVLYGLRKRSRTQLLAAAALHLAGIAASLYGYQN